MYQVLQVYISFRFSLIDNFLSRSIKVGQALSWRRRLRDLEAMFRRLCSDFVATFPQTPWSPAGV